MNPQELKNSILQMAIQGKLVEQRPEEGTGKQLFHQIKKYQRDIKVGKDELNYDSMDFDIPDSWAMVELNQLFNFVDYRGKTPTKISHGVFLITASNIKKGTMDYKRKEYISQEEYIDRQSRGITRKGDLLFTTEAPMGNAAVCDLDNCSCGQRIITFQQYAEGTTLPTLFMYFLLSPQVQKQLQDNCTGTTAKGIKADKLKHFRLPLPPYAEQKRIVAKVEELLSYIDRYEQAWSKLEDFNKCFPTNLQKSILQMAIQGKLVEQRHDEGTAEKLYQQIQAEKQKLIKAGKIKKEKLFPEVTEDEKPFEIPESWKWVRLGDISTYTHRKEKIRAVNISGDAWSLDLEDIEKNTGKIIQNCKSSDRVISGDKIVFHKGEILYSKLRPYLKKVLVAPYDGICSSEIVPFQTYFSIDSQYLVRVLVSPYVDNVINAVTYGVKMPRVGTDTMENLLIPLPPLAEQKRIVAKIEELLPLCETLKR